MDRGAWQATVHRVAQNWTQLNEATWHAFMYAHKLHEIDRFGTKIENSTDSRLIDNRSQNIM